jgi:hypothetical protein
MGKTGPGATVVTIVSLMVSIFTGVCGLALECSIFSTAHKTASGIHMREEAEYRVHSSAANWSVHTSRISLTDQRKKNCSPSASQNFEFMKQLSKSKGCRHQNQGVDDGVIAMISSHKIILPPFRDSVD